MRTSSRLLTVMAVLVMALAATDGRAQAREEGRLLMASEVLEELRATRDQAIPDRLLDRAYGIAVVPNVTKIAFIAGGRRGKGILVVRDKNGRFTNPVFISLTGGSIGWQAGVQSTDIVLVFTTRAGIEGITDGKLTLGADASVAAGPVGRQASAATDPSFTAEVYSYSRSSGLFAGVALDGTALTIDNRANANFYGKRGVTASDIINGAVTTNKDAARRFLAAVTASTSTARPATATAASASPSDTAARDPDQPAMQAQDSTPPASSGVRTFPMADPQPGEEPR